MPKWTEYTTKDTLADNDEVMLYDATARANKRGLMSKFWDYVVDKMATAVISKLETNNKTIIGAINALNSERGITTYDAERYTKKYCNIFVESAGEPVKPSAVLVIGYEGVGVAMFANMLAGNYATSYRNISGEILYAIDAGKIAVNFSDGNRIITIIHPTSIAIALKEVEKNI
jgi:hypothetical protein